MGGLAGWFAERGEIPLLPPPRVREYGPLGDDPDPANAEFSDESIRGLALAIEYCDQRGWLSRRTIRCLALSPSAPACFKAHCNVRGTIRVFRFDRVVSAFDLRTGRMLTGEEHAAILSPYLPQHVCEPDVAAMRRLHEAARPGVFLLLQLAMAEGRLGDPERAIVMDYVWAEAEALELAFPAEHALLWLDNLAPPLEAIVAAVEELLAQKDKFARLLPRLLKLVRIRDGAAQEQSVTDLFAAVRAEYRQKLGQSTATATARAGEGVPRRDRPAVA